jgi:hypothetical protein
VKGLQAGLSPRKAKVGLGEDLALRLRLEEVNGRQLLFPDEPYHYEATLVSASDTGNAITFEIQPKSRPTGWMPGDMEFQSPILLEGSRITASSDVRAGRFFVTVRLICQIPIVSPREGAIDTITTGSVEIEIVAPGKADTVPSAPAPAP